MKLNLGVLKDTFAICRFEKNSPLPRWVQKGDFWSITQTINELSIVCKEDSVKNVEKVEKGWRAIKIENTLDFTMIGILANLSGILASVKIGMFAVSTYDTDYIFVKKENLEKACNLFRKAGHKVKN